MKTSWLLMLGPAGMEYTDLDLALKRRGHHVIRAAMDHAEALIPALPWRAVIVDARRAETMVRPAVARALEGRAAVVLTDAARPHEALLRLLAPAIAVPHDAPPPVWDLALTVASACVAGSPPAPSPVTA